MKISITPKRVFSEAYLQSLDEQLAKEARLDPIDRGSIERVTPYLVLKQSQVDRGKRPLGGNIDPDMGTLEVFETSRPTITLGEDQPLHAIHTYGVRGQVWNLGSAPSLMGIAELYVVEFRTLQTKLSDPAAVSVTPLELLTFSLWPGQTRKLNFRRTFTPTPGTRVAVVLHAYDLTHDRLIKPLDGAADRHVAGRIFSVSRPDPRVQNVIRPNLGPQR